MKDRYTQSMGMVNLFGFLMMGFFKKSLKKFKTELLDSSYVITPVKLGVSLICLKRGGGGQGGSRGEMVDS